MSNNTNIDDKSGETDAGRRDIAIDPPSFKDLPNTSASQANVYNEMKGDSSANSGHGGETSSDSKFLESDPSIGDTKSVNIDSNMTSNLENNIAHPTSNGFLDSSSRSPADHNQEDTTTFTNDRMSINCTSANMDAEHNSSNNAKSLPMYTQSSNTDDPSKAKDPQDLHHIPKDQLQAKEVKTLMTFSNNHKSESTFGNKGGAEENHVTTSSQSLSSLKGVGGNKTLWQCILSRTFALYLFWAVVVQIVLSMALGSFNAWLTFVTKNDDSEISKYTDVLFYSMLGSPLLALSIGVGMDAMKRVKTKDRNAINRRTLHTAVMSLGVTSVLCLVVCALFMSCDRDTIVVTSIALVVFRTGLYSCGTAFLRIMYPTQYFGMLCGIMTVLAGGLSFLQYPLFLWVQLRDSAWAEAFGFLGILGLLSLSQPVYLYWKSRQFKQTINTV